MYKKELLPGAKFGEWTVIEQIQERKDGYIVYKVKCSCGIEAFYKSNYLISEKSSCCRSCSAKKNRPKGEHCYQFKHGAAIRTNELRQTYNIWLMMKQRCKNPNDKSYSNYGGRGISICEKWENFEGFLEDMGKKPQGLSIERIDNEKGYFKENCKWATRKEQNNNRRDNTYFIIDGIKVTRTQIQDLMKWTRSMYRRRFEKYGLDFIIDSYKEKMKYQ